MLDGIFGEFHEWKTIRGVAMSIAFFSIFVRHQTFFNFIKYSMLYTNRVHCVGVSVRLTAMRFSFEHAMYAYFSSFILTKQLSISYFFFKRR